MGGRSKKAHVGRRCKRLNQEANKTKKIKNQKPRKKKKQKKAFFLSTGTLFFAGLYAKKN
jgi:hypothetical protein